MDIKISTKLNKNQLITDKLCCVNPDATPTQQTKNIENWIKNNPIYSGIELAGATITNINTEYRKQYISELNLTLSAYNKKHGCNTGYPLLNLILPKKAIEILRKYKFRQIPWHDVSNNISFRFDTINNSNIVNNKIYSISSRSFGNFSYGYSERTDFKIDFRKSAFDGKIYVWVLLNGGKVKLLLRDNAVVYSDIKPDLADGKREILIHNKQGNKYLALPQINSISSVLQLQPESNIGLLTYFYTGKITTELIAAYSGLLKEYEVSDKNKQNKIIRKFCKNGSMINNSIFGKQTDKFLIQDLDDKKSIKCFLAREKEPFNTIKNLVRETKILPRAVAHKPINLWSLNDLVDANIINVDIRADIVNNIRDNQKPEQMGQIIDYNPAQGWLIKPNKPLNRSGAPMLILLLICPTKQNRYLHFVPERVNTGRYIPAVYEPINTVEKARRLMMFRGAGNSGRDLYKSIEVGLMDTVPAITES